MTKTMEELCVNCAELAQSLLLPKYARDSATLMCLIIYIRSLTYPELVIIKNDFNKLKGQFTRESMTLSEVINEIDCIRERLEGYE